MVPHSRTSRRAGSHGACDHAAAEPQSPLARRARSHSPLSQQWKRIRELSHHVASKTSQLSDSVNELSQHVAAKTSQLSDSVNELSQHVAAKTSQLSDSIFGHMLTGDAIASAAMARRRALMMVDVLVERHGEGRLKWRWLLAATLICFCYLHYALPAYASWGTRFFENSVGANEFAETVGGAYSRVSFGVLVLVTLTYLVMLHSSSRLMEARLPVRRMIFESLVVYNTTQMLLNLYVFVNLLKEARAQGFQYAWGNKFNYTQDSHRLGYFIWLHYHCCQLELFDTFFVVIRKKFQQITFLHVWLRLLNMLAWFLACRYACGGDTYFPAAANAATRAVVYAFYSLSLLTKSGSGVPFLRKARITELQMIQFGLCALHALFCLYKFWDMEIPRSVLILYFLVMMNGLMLFSDFHYQAKDKSEARVESERKVSFAFDSSGWLYCYHFGVAAYLREHLLPEGLAPDNVAERFPSHITFSGCSGGSLVSATLCLGLQPNQVFEMVLEKRHGSRFNPFRMLPAMEEVVNRMLPANAWEILTGRIRVLLTRVSLKYPFFSAEVVNKFSNNQDVFHALRASCHMPVVGGFFPYRYDNHSYLDGMFWPQMLVPWRGTPDDFVVRVSVVSMLFGDIKTSYLPMWWALFPPEEDVLRGLFWLGYSDAARWFTRQPSNQGKCSTRCGVPTPTTNGRRRTHASETDLDGKASEEERLSTWLAAQKSLLRKPSGAFLPDVDEITGKNPAEFLELCQAAIERDRQRLIALLMLSVVPGIAWFCFGCL